MEPLEAWIDAPYSAVIRDGAIFARGTVDNKNGIAAKICAVDAWQKVHGAIPCGVKFFIEGEEEIIPYPSHQKPPRQKRGMER